MKAPSARWVRRIAVGLVALLAAGFAVGSLAGRSGDDVALSRYDADTQSNAMTAEAYTARRSVKGVSAGTALDGAQAAPAVSGGLGSALPPLPDRIVKNGDLTIEARDDRFEAAWSQAFRVATSFGGYVASSSRGISRTESRDAGRTGEITIRVPAARFEAAMTELRKIGRVVGDNVGSQDVTQEFTDLEARLRNLKSQEAVLLRLMAAAKSVQDTLVVQEHLANVQGEIEQIQGRLKLLRNQTELSTINVHLAGPGAIGLLTAGSGPSFSQAWETAVEGLERIGTVVMIAGIWLAPFAALAALILALTRRRAPVAEQG